MLLKTGIDNHNVLRIKPMRQSFKLKNVLDFTRFSFLKRNKKSASDAKDANLASKSQTTESNRVKKQAEYVKEYASTGLVEFVSDAVQEKDLVIAAAYRQVFGNAHLMESERVVSAESQLRSGQISVMEFIRQLAKSERYRTLVFEKNSNLRVIELNFKHLLGRAPKSYAEVSEHILCLTNQGFEAEIDSYLDSDEYFQAFGTNIVPYYRGYQTQNALCLSGYAYSSEFVQGASSSDGSTPRTFYTNLDKSLLSDSSKAFTKLLNKVNVSDILKKFPLPPRPLFQISKYGSKSSAPSSNIYSPEAIIRRASKRKY
ncbi:MAG: phycobilisome rod-core linker polypeptide [Cyanobacteria bacterium P01_H01_bin.15]